MIQNVKVVRIPRTNRTYAFNGCPLTRHQGLKCFRSCVPAADDRGPCGRIAPHSIKSQIQQAIENHKRRLTAELSGKPQINS